jgi:hypothetical protein
MMVVRRSGVLLVGEKVLKSRFLFWGTRENHRHLIQHTIRRQQTCVVNRVCPLGKMIGQRSELRDVNWLRDSVSGLCMKRCSNS